MWNVTIILYGGIRPLARPISPRRPFVPGSGELWRAPANGLANIWAVRRLYCFKSFSLWPRSGVFSAIRPWFEHCRAVVHVCMCTTNATEIWINLHMVERACEWTFGEGAGREILPSSLTCIECGDWAWFAFFFAERNKSMNSYFIVRICCCFHFNFNAVHARIYAHSNPLA